MRLFWTLLAVLVAGCGSDPVEPMADSPVDLLVDPSGSPRAWRFDSSAAGRTAIGIDVDPVQTIGDSALVRVVRYNCGPYCSMHSADTGLFKVTTDLPDVASVHAGDYVVFHRSGVVWVTAERGDTVFQQRITILPPVASFAWEPYIISARVGEIVRTKAVARDFRGRVVAIFPAMTLQVFMGGTEKINMHAWGGPDGTVFSGNVPVLARLEARIGDRTAAMNIIIGDPFAASSQ